MLSRKIVILAVLCIFAALLAGCTSTERLETSGPELTVQPTPGGEMTHKNMTAITGDVNQTIYGERGLQPADMNMTPGGSFQPPGEGGAPDWQSRQPGPMNGSPPSPGEMPGGMKPPEQAT